jgi:hypothetical protein
LFADNNNNINSIGITMTLFLKQSPVMVTRRCQKCKKEEQVSEDTFMFMCKPCTDSIVSEELSKIEDFYLEYKIPKVELCCFCNAIIDKSCDFPFINKDTFKSEWRCMQCDKKDIR